MIGGVLGMGRRAAESRMRDRCRVERVTGTEFIESTGKYEDTFEVVYPTAGEPGKCRIVASSTAGREADSGGRLLVVTTPEVHLPVGTLVAPGDIVTCTGSDDNPALAGRSWKIAAPFDASQTTALRLRLEVPDGK